MRIDILSKPNENCDYVERIVKIAAKTTNTEVQITRTSNFAAYSHCAINPSQTPIVIINGSVEFAGKVLELEAVKKRLAEINRLGY